LHRPNNEEVGKVVLRKVYADHAMLASLSQPKTIRQAVGMHIEKGG
jgi:hypothetical protein